jgi:hypothetical protein
MPCVILAQLLKPGGKFVATAPAFRSLWTNHDVLNHHQTRYTKATLRAVASQTGLKIEEERYIYYWTCLVKLAVRFMEQVLKSDPKPPKIPAHWLNESLYKISCFEQRTLAPLPMPFGSSLLVVATKEHRDDNTTRTLLEKEKAANIATLGPKSADRCSVNFSH